jgi:hypothetical protein
LFLLPAELNQGGWEYCTHCLDVATICFLELFGSPPNKCLFVFCYYFSQVIIKTVCLSDK